MVCLEWSILELWGSDGTYDEITDEEIATLTQQSILDKINEQGFQSLTDEEHRILRERSGEISRRIDRES